MSEPPFPRDPLFQCVCVPLVGRGGKLVPQPSPDCPVPGHKQLALQLIAACEGLTITGRRR